MAAWEKSSSSTLCFLSPLSYKVYKNRPNNVLKGVKTWLMKALWYSSFSLLCKAELTTTEPPRINWKLPLMQHDHWALTWALSSHLTPDGHFPNQFWWEIQKHKLRFLFRRHNFSTFSFKLIASVHLIQTNRSYLGFCCSVGSFWGTSPWHLATEGFSSSG